MVLVVGKHILIERSFALVEFKLMKGLH